MIHCEGHCESLPCPPSCSHTRLGFLCPLFPSPAPMCWASPADPHLSSFADTGYSSTNPNMVGEPWSTWAKRVPGSLWEIEMQVNLTASFLPAAQYPKHLPTCLPVFLPSSFSPSVSLRQRRFAGHFAPSPSAVFISKGFAWFGFLM